MNVSPRWPSGGFEGSLGWFGRPKKTSVGLSLMAILPQGSLLLGLNYFAISDLMSFGNLGKERSTPVHRRHKSRISR